MVKKLALLCCALLVMGTAKATVLNFDDIITGGTVVNMPVNYGGISWDANYGVYGFSQPPYNPKSPPNRVLFDMLTFGPGESVFSFLGDDGILDGAYFAGDSSSSGAVSFNLYHDGLLVHTSGSLLPSATPTFLSSGYSGPVDQVGVFAALGRGFVVMDDLAFTTTPESAPEPSSLLLLGTSLAGLIGFARCRLS